MAFIADQRFGDGCDRLHSNSSIAIKACIAMNRTSLPATAAMAAALLWAVLVLCLLLTSARASLEEPLLIRQVQSSDSNLIVDLPGAPSVTFAQYSGYITVDEKTGRSLFYWFVEADVPDPTSAPLTLWLNGGPGCSSVGGGMLSELGPFYPDKDGLHLQLNPYSWNKVSNIVFLESPAGVGFSYSNSPNDYNTGDAKTAEDAYVFLQKFWQLYPLLSQNHFYIAGESYAGHYVPQLAALIIEKQKLGLSSIKFKGIAVGNAWTDPAIDNYGAAFFWWTHAIISDETFHGLTTSCDFAKVGPLQNKDPALCDQFVTDADNDLGNCCNLQNFINIYDIYVDVCLSAQAHAQAVQFAKQLNRNTTGALGALPLLSSFYDPCIDNEVQAYLNRPEVQAALHANVTRLPYPWTDCSNLLNYSYKDVLSSVLPTYHTLLQSGIEIFVFSGDVDAIVPVTGTRSWISKLKLEIKKEWRPWFVNSQVGGYVTEYKGLTFVTVRDAGHMVPYTQPARALHLFSSFISGKPL
ncbi:hypothetical protein O6H91_19G031300 [Diphasiastrum complanatum]|uniref:Uncharacterized protein n=1 Tax=Diphasiastrum complanatum TaxID=34168 RepID=A0ACC2AV84_DIPCM|nr:hypothetical protein O6H91_19G031300 [Diphasiastrum complanatum]